jgi:hypothetical protein
LKDWTEVGLVHAYPCAVSDRVGTERLFLCASNSGDHRLFPTAKREAIDVDALTLDSVDELKGASVDFIKIDAQGSETRILRGATGLLSRSADVVGIVELAPEHLKLGGSSVKELSCVLGELGFLAYVKAGGRFIQVKLKDLCGRRHHTNIAISRTGLP